MLGGLCAVSLVLGGCSSTPEVDHTLVTTLTWPDGQPTSDLENDPWVQALRRYRVILAAARNALNYADPNVSEVMTPDLLSRQYLSARSGVRDDSLFLWEGPGSFAPLAVQGTSDGAVVTICDAPYTTVERYPYEFPTRRIEYHLLEMNGRRVVAFSSSTEDACDLSDARRALFDPGPDLDLLDLTDPDVVLPPPGHDDDR